MLRRREATGRVRDSIVYVWFASKVVCCERALTTVKVLVVNSRSSDVEMLGDALSNQRIGMASSQRQTWRPSLSRERAGARSWRLARFRRVLQHRLEIASRRRCSTEHLRLRRSIVCGTSIERGRRKRELIGDLQFRNHELRR